MLVKIGIFQAIGLMGVGLFGVGGILNFFVQMNPPANDFGVGLPLFLAGGVILWVGIIGAWVQGIARATRAWDEVRKGYTAPPK